eukprot:3485470-Amphidinium_carterae.1
MRLAFDQVHQLPACELMHAIAPGRFHTPTTALVALLKMRGFDAGPEGIVNPQGLHLPWPPESRDACLHDLRVMQRFMLTKEMLPQLDGRDMFDRDRSLPCASLTQTQKNFWRTLQLDAHKGLFEN